MPQGAAVIRLYRREGNRKAGAFARRKLSKMRFRSAISSVYLKNWNNSVDGIFLILSRSICAKTWLQIHTSDLLMRMENVNGAKAIARGNLIFLPSAGAGYARGNDRYLLCHWVIFLEEL